MHALKSRPGTARGTFPDHGDDPSTDAEGVAQRIWRTLIGRLQYGKKVESAFVDTPRSNEDVAHFKLMWKATGRDVYRFTEW